MFKNSAVRRISETFNIQFRMEFFNVLNHANFTTPSNNQIWPEWRRAVGKRRDHNRDLDAIASNPFRIEVHLVELKW